MGARVRMRRWIRWAYARAGAGVVVFAAVVPGWPPGAGVKSIEVRGITAGREGDARRLLAIPTGAAPDSATVAQGLARLVRALEDEGFLLARVDSVGVDPADRPGPDGRGEPARLPLVLWLDPGPRHLVGPVTWEGLERVAPGEAAALTGLVAGAPFRPGQLEAGLGRLLDAYENRASPDARVSVLDMDRRTTEVALFLRVFEGDSLTVTEVAFKGARATRRSVLEKCVRDAVGLPYNRARLLAARQRLADLGVFRSVGEPVLESVGPGRGRVVFPVEESTANVFDGAIGYQGEQGSVTGLVDLALGNLGGTARQAALRWEGRGAGVSEFRLGYAEPLLFGLDLRGEAGFQQHVEDTLYTRTRGHARFVFGFWNGARFWLLFAADRTVLDEGTTERATTGSTEAGFDADRRDDPYRPRRGYRLALASATVFKRITFRPEGGSRATQLYAWLRGQQNWQVSPGTGFRLELDGALRLSNETVVPYYDLDPIGGATSLRGYREQEFRASRWVVARTEYGVFPRGSGRAFAFVDQGVLYRPFLTPEGFATSETLYRIGYGAGFELPSEVGTVGLSLGWGEGDGPLDGKLHVRLTNRF